VSHRQNRRTKRGRLCEEGEEEEEEEEEDEGETSGS